MELHGLPGPEAPLPQKTADDADPLFAPARTHDTVLGEQVEDDVVVVAGVESDRIFLARVADGAHNVEGAVAVEGGHFNGQDVVDHGEGPPEFVGQDAPANVRLEVEAHQGDHFGYGAAMVDHGFDGVFLERRIAPKGRHAHEAGMVALADQELSLGESLLRAATDAADLDHRPGALGRIFVDHRRDAGQDLLEKVYFGIADFELGGVDAHGYAARARIDIVAHQGALPDFVIASIGLESQGHGGDYGSFLYTPAYELGQLCYGHMVHPFRL
ncbi:hypothetical protein TRIP_E160150 [uncultured Spirochaetota bacterium]|uniref:Uncharacterized protein n=1 Tax=uncultured Spirochaetota bacterium TaxID=460511 RepID=A0A652ZT44_9SPIR|nr:hypothetical protein TRIP_E160150 [uncultured Spirochaetota bacterium]